ncbi:hypothetical protein [Chelativorans composti]|uniref:hypothetical protein n=1 Tax=Chelativorans composti TaxID=768533 RepID=UPI0031EF133F
MTQGNRRFPLVLPLHLFDHAPLTRKKFLFQGVFFAPIGQSKLRRGISNYAAEWFGGI